MLQVREECLVGRERGWGRKMRDEGSEVRMMARMRARDKRDSYRVRGEG